MVVTYLEKIRNNFMEQKIDISEQLVEVQTLRKENAEFIKLLEQNNDSSFEAFTPRTVNSFHKRKIEELKEEQKSIDLKINDLLHHLNNIENEIEEVSAVIKVAKERLS